MYQWNGINERGKEKGKKKKERKKKNPHLTSLPLNSFSGEVFADIMEAEPEDVESAVKSASDAFVSWSALSGFQRAKYMYAIAR